MPSAAVQDSRSERTLSGLPEVLVLLVTTPGPGPCAPAPVVMRELRRRWPASLICVHVADPDDALLDALGIDAVPAWLRWSASDAGARRDESEETPGAEETAGAEQAAGAEETAGTETALCGHALQELLLNQHPLEVLALPAEGMPPDPDLPVGWPIDDPELALRMLTEMLEADAVWAAAERAFGALPKHEVNTRFGRR